MARRLPWLVLLALVACDPRRESTDSGALDAPSSDVPADPRDAPTNASDSGETARDATPFSLDAPSLDAEPTDVGPADALASTDAATASPDARVPPDAYAPPDAFLPPDARSGGCVSGASGTHAVRFRWEGSGPGSTAYVRYEENELPDTSRWRVTANSRSIGYRPVFDDTFLGEGGLDLEGTAFIDVELSLSGLSSVRGVTLAIYGRSFATTTSGSFTWQTFDGTGAAPRDLVANSAPYEWYAADATTEFTAGDAGVLIRIYPGPSSGALIVNRVEICFDAT